MLKTKDELVEEIDFDIINQKSNKIRFGRYLVHTDKAVRDKTVAALRIWLGARCHSAQLSDLDLAKIWRGLWYCVWMCDKAPFQRELATNISSFVHLFSEDKLDAFRFQTCFYETMRRDWIKIDKFRLNKYYSLIRHFLREGLKFCIVEGMVKVGLLMGLMSILRDECLLQLPNGFRMHVADIFLCEAYIVFGTDMPTSTLMILLEPWIKIVEFGEIPGQGIMSHLFIEAILKNIFKLLADFCPRTDRFEQEMEENPRKMYWAKIDLLPVQEMLQNSAKRPNKFSQGIVRIAALYKKITKSEGLSSEQAHWPFKDIMDGMGSNLALRLLKEENLEDGGWEDGNSVPIKKPSKKELKRLKKQNEKNQKRLSNLKIEDQKTIGKKRKEPAVEGWAAKAFEKGEIKEETSKVENQRKKKKAKRTDKKLAAEINAVSPKGPSKSLLLTSSFEISKQKKLLKIHPEASLTNGNAKPAEKSQPTDRNIRKEVNGQYPTENDQNLKCENLAPLDGTELNKMTRPSLPILGAEKGGKAGQGKAPENRKCKRKMGQISVGAERRENVAEIAVEPSTPEIKIMGRDAGYFSKDAAVGDEPKKAEAKKRVTFGKNNSKDFRNSIRDLVRKPLFSSDRPKVPPKGVLKVKTSKYEAMKRSAFPKEKARIAKRLMRQYPSKKKLFRR